MCKFRYLTADEVDARIGTYKEGKGLSLLLYKDGRVDQKLLDETVGAMNWQRSHTLIDGQLFCTVSIWDSEKKIWVSKQDVGTESNTEAEKGRSSDSFKRACFNWGIGRELYTAPFIWITEDKGGKYDKYVVTEMSVVDGQITTLKIVNSSRKNALVYSYGTTSKQEATTTNYITQPQLALLEQMLEVKRVAKDTILNTYKLKDLTQMTVEQFNNCTARLKNTGDK